MSVESLEVTSADPTLITVRFANCHQEIDVAQSKENVTHFEFFAF